MLTKAGYVAAGVVLVATGILFCIAFTVKGLPGL